MNQSGHVSGLQRLGVVPGVAQHYAQTLLEVITLLKKAHLDEFLGNPFTTLEIFIFNQIAETKVQLAIFQEISQRLFFRLPQSPTVLWLG